MKWSFEISETSNGAYQCVGTRSTGNTVSIHCGEDEIFRVFKEAYELEAKLGTLPSQALFIIVSGAKKAWRSEYNEGAFGSWMVEDRNDKNSYVYYGKDFYLTIYKAKKNPYGRVLFRNKMMLKTQFLNCFVSKRFTIVCSRTNYSLC